MSLTAHDQACFAWAERKTALGQLREPNHEELVARVTDLEIELAPLQTALAVPRKQMLRLLMDSL